MEPLDATLAEGCRIRDILPPERPSLPVCWRPSVSKAACPVFVQRPCENAWEEQASELPEIPGASGSRESKAADLATGKVHHSNELHRSSDSEGDSSVGAQSFDFGTELDTTVETTVGVGGSPRSPGSSSCSAEDCWLENPLGLHALVASERARQTLAIAAPPVLRAPQRGRFGLPRGWTPACASFGDTRPCSRPLPGPPESPRMPLSASVGLSVASGFLWSDLDIQVEDADPSNVILEDAAPLHLPPASASSVLSSDLGWGATRRYQLPAVRSRTLSTDVVRVTGGESHHRLSMGAYVPTDIPSASLHGGRPIYRNPHDSYLYFWSATGNWLISGDHQQDIACLASKVEEHTLCPSTTTGWKLFRDGGLHWEPKMSVTKARQPRCNLADQLIDMAAAASQWKEGCDERHPEGVCRQVTFGLPLAQPVEHDRGGESQLHRQGLFDLSAGSFSNTAEQLLSLSMVVESEPTDVETFTC